MRVSESGREPSREEHEALPLVLLFPCPQELPVLIQILRGKWWDRGPASEMVSWLGRRLGTVGIIATVRP